MLDNLDLTISLDKETYRTKIEDLMRELRSLQNICWLEKLPIVVVLEGWAAAGKGGLVKQMTNYMDPRGFVVHPILAPSEEEKKYPFLWRFWQKLPPKGSIGIFYHSWYTHLLEDRLFGRLENTKVPTIMRDINAFESQLIEDGAVVAKFWLHLSKKELQNRLKDYEKDEFESWRVRKEDWQQAKNYTQYKTLAEEMLIYTSSGFAPWVLVEADCQRWAKFKVLTQLVSTIREALAKREIITQTPSLPPQISLSPTEADYLSQVDLTLNLPKEEYKVKLKQSQLQLRKLQKDIFEKNIGILILFEGWDAAGKGGAIKRITDILDPRSYEVHAFAAPTKEEHLYHYLWRFWRRLTPTGKIGIFDRSWYGRVLVERIENFATETEWRRAYREINEFEAQLASSNYIILKYWLHISPEEQLKRFELRKLDPYKSYKLTDEDYRNREKWNLYDVAINQTIARTSTPQAPWTIVPGNDKYYARLNVLETLINAIKYKLGN
ncbi:polyphosphate:AMP phosphotransferase [Geminocystis sp.]|uniref:polyphosphate:AMP phosphotransferase n=1 Tax=Geminocystis sp. TaxID=2664100 RepID=UPI003592F5B0